MNNDDFNVWRNSFHENVLSKAMNEEEQTNYTESLFESIRHVNEYGQEF